MVTKVIKKRGRPSKKTSALCNEIAERLSEGEPLAQICRDKHMPHPTNVRIWMGADEAFSLAIARGRENGEDRIAADCLAIADECTNDYMSTKTGDGADAYRFNGEHIQRSKLRIDTRLKLLAKWNPKKWGDRTIIAGDENAPIVTKQDNSLPADQAYKLIIEGKTVE